MEADALNARTHDLLDMLSLYIASVVDFNGERRKY